MDTQSEFLESRLQILQDIHSNIKKMLNKSMADVEQTTAEAGAATKRCQQLVNELAEARQEEQMLLNEINELREGLHD